MRLARSPATPLHHLIHNWAGTFLTQDPGRALITGKCSDTGSILMQQFRELTPRAPYFTNGSVADLGR